MKKTVRIVATGVTAAALSTAAPSAQTQPAYKGAPFADSRHAGRAQSIPGRVELASYDLGGEGVAYHDSDPQNHGSGELNPANGSYLNEFRLRDGVDISYTKFGNRPYAIDDTPFDKDIPPADQLYVGWTEVGEWLNFTVNVARAGTYSADLLYTSNRGGTLSIDVNGADAAGQLDIPSTYDQADPMAWRQWHHWRIQHGLVTLRLAAGRNVLTVRVTGGGNMNLAYLDFKKAG